MKYFLPISLLLIIAGCCTKKACENRSPEINVRIVEQTGNWINTTLYTIDRTSGSIDTFGYSNERSITISEDYISLPNGLGAYDYIVATDSSSDTISNINYIVSESKIVCNKCAAGDDMQTVKHYNNFSYKHEGNSYGLNDTLVITL